VFRLEYYEPEDMEVIVRRSARILEVEANDEAVSAIAACSRGTPRIANRLLKRNRDYALVMADGCIDGPVAEAALKQLSVDRLGLDQSDHRLLASIIDKFDGGPVGLETLAASVNEDADTIMDVWEPYLLQIGFLERTPRGRVATRLAHEFLDRPFLSADPTDQGRLSGF
jgi:Holliday junction DNA helicase RuvB